MDYNDIVQKICDVCSPQAIWLFGSQAKGTATVDSDLDICIITETANGRDTARKVYRKVRTGMPTDFVVFSTDNWNEQLSDSLSFANTIAREGRLLYARQ